MNSRDRVLRAIAGRKVDRVPFDLGSSRVTSITRDAYIDLATHLDIPVKKDSIPIWDYMQQLPVMDSELVDFLGVDVRGVRARTVRTDPDIIEKDDCWEYVDEFQARWRKPKSGGLYFDVIESPLSGEIGGDDIDNFDWPDPTKEALFFGLKEQAKSYSEEGYAVIMDGIGGGIFETACRVRGYENLYKDFVARPELAARLLGRITQLKENFWKKVGETMGEYIDIVREGDDIAGEENLLMSPDSYRELLKPNHTELFSTIKNEFPEPIFLFFHSDGAIRDVIPDFIKSGIDILNPIQPGLPGMEAAEIAEEFGDKIALWGGGCDPLDFLINANPWEVEEKTNRKLSRILEKTSSFVFASIHNVQSDIPPKNLMAMIRGLYKAQGLEFDLKTPKE